MKAEPRLCRINGKVYLPGGLRFFRLSPSPQMLFDQVYKCMNIFVLAENSSGESFVSSSFAAVYGGIFFDQRAAVHRRFFARTQKNGHGRLMYQKEDLRYAAADFTRNG